MQKEKSFELFWASSIQLTWPQSLTSSVFWCSSTNSCLSRQYLHFRSSNQCSVGSTCSPCVPYTPPIRFILIPAVNSQREIHRKYPARRSTALTQENAICSSVILFNHLSCDSHRPVMKEEYIYVTASPWEQTFSRCNVRSARQFDRNATLYCHSGYSLQRRDGAS